MNKLFKFLSKNSLMLSIIIVSISFVLFYPTKFATIDEHDYLGNAENILEGTLKQECSGGESQFKVEKYCIYKYNIGTSLFLVPSVLTDSDLAFFTTFILFVFSIFIFRKILNLLNISEIFLYFYALFPPFVYYTRTLLSEIYSLTFFVVLVYLVLKNRSSRSFILKFLIGLTVPLLILIRYTNIIPIALLLILSLAKECREKNNFKKLIKKWLPTFITSSTLSILILFFNNYLYQHPFRSGYFFSGEEAVFVLSEAPKMLFLYFLLLNAVYPFMLGVSIVNKSKLRPLLIGPFLATLIFYSLMGEKIIIEGRLLDLIIGIRFFIPTVGFLLILFFQFLNRFIKKEAFKVLLIISILILSVNTFLLSMIHNNFLTSN